MGTEKINMDKQEKGSKDGQTPCNLFEKYTYTMLLLMIHMVYAMSYATFGPAFVDFKHILNTTMQWISLFSTLISVGNILGTFFGLTFKYLNRQLTIVALLVVMAVTSTSVPFSSELWQFYVCAVLYGLGVGAWTATNNVWLIEMWQNKSGQVLFLSQLMYGVGAIIGPLIDSPYLTGEVPDERPYNLTLDFHTDTNQTKFISRGDRRHKLMTPFLVSGAIQITLPILMTIMFIIRRYKPRTEAQVNTSDKSVKLFEQSGKPRALVIALMAISLSTINSLELVYFNFGSTYMQFATARLTASTAANIMSVLSGAYAAGQVINFFVAMCVRTKHIIVYHFVIAFVSIIAINFIEAELGFWILSVVLGFGFSALFPGIFALMSKYIEVDNQVGTIIYLACGVVNFVPPLILGSYIENNPIVFIIIQLVYLFICSTTFLLILIIIKRNK